VHNQSKQSSYLAFVITYLVFQARPVYVTLPMDLVKEEISSDRLSIPLSSALPPNDPDTELFILDLIQERIAAAGSDVIVLVDACVIRHHCRDEVLDLLKKTGLPVYGTPMGKTAIAEGYERYGGVCFIPSPDS
jgi:pyruvate decarboxylase